MIDQEEILAIANDYEAGLKRALASGYEEFGPTWERRQRFIIAALHRYAQGAPDTPDGFNFHQHLKRQREWSGKTFGPGPRTKGVVDHIRKELREIESDPLDIMEWIDVVILALDGAWRAGAYPDQIISAIVAKQTKNEGRQWPDWRTADPENAIEHVKGSAVTSTDGGAK
jgi:hypothetical protein